MSRVIVALTETGYSPIADSLYNFIQTEDNLPSEDKVIELFKTCKDMNEYGHKINSLFIECVRTLLLKRVPAPNYHQANHLLRIKEEFCANDSSEDSFTLSFAGITYQDPSESELEPLNDIIRSYDFDYLEGKVSVATTYTLSVPADAITRIKDIDNDGICEPIVDYSGGAATTHIIEVGYIRDRMDQHSSSWSNAGKYYEAIWNIISDYIPNFMDIKAHKPEFLVLYVQAD